MSRLCSNPKSTSVQLNLELPEHLKGGPSTSFYIPPYSTFCLSEMHNWFSILSDLRMLLLPLLPVPSLKPVLDRYHQLRIVDLLISSLLILLGQTGAPHEVRNTMKWTFMIFSKSG